MLSFSFDMCLHSFQDTELKLYRYVNDSPGQVMEGLTILRFSRLKRQKTLFDSRFDGRVTSDHCRVTVQRLF